MNCPNCSSVQTWIEKDGNCDWLRCRCGLMDLVEKREDGVIIKHRASSSQVTLPKKDTQLREALMVIASYGVQSTGDVSKVLNKESPKVATLLKMLETGGLLSVVERRRGKIGGSIWELSRIAKKLLGD